MDDEPLISAEEQRDADDGVGELRERGRFTAGNPYRFPPGRSGNPGGRSASAKRALERALERLKKLVPDIAEFENASELAFLTVLLELRGKDRRARLRAAEIVLDREQGRVPVAVRLGPDDDDGPSDIRIRLVGPGDVDLSKRSMGGDGNGNGNGSDPA